MTGLRSFSKRLIPQWVHNAHARYLSRKLDRDYGSLPVKQIFEATYRDRLWGAHSDFGCYSGLGSHDPAIVDPYIREMTRFLASFTERPSVIDLGCGDFNVGRQIRHLCSEYTACDIAGNVIAQNRQKYAELAVRFLELDLIDDPLPDADIACIRQVLQHLSNQQIALIVPKLAKYRNLVVTEHLPRGRRFRPNSEKPAGPGTRLALNSGIVLTEPPFSLKVLDQRTLCSVDQLDGTIDTVVYRLF